MRHICAVVIFERCRFRYAGLLSEIMCPALRMPRGCLRDRSEETSTCDGLLSIDTRHRLFGGAVDKKFDLEASVETERRGDERRGLLLLEP